MSSKNEFEGLTPHSQSVFGINQLNVKKYHDFSLMITKGLKKQGNVVLRFWEYDILKNPEIFRQKILKAIKKSKPTAL